MRDEQFPKWADVKKSIILRKKKRPRYDVGGTPCYRYKLAEMRGAGIMMWFEPMIMIPRLSYVDGDGKMHADESQIIGPLAVLRKNGEMNGKLLLPRGLTPLNDAAWNELRWRTAKACGARRQYVSPYTGAMRYE